MSRQREHMEMEILESEEFSFEGFQVVRGEFFAHTYEPSLSFSDYKVYVNTACIRKLPEFEYIQILVNPEQKKIAVRPCREEERDSFKWCSAGGKRMPKQITCRIFFAKVFTLMGWNPIDRYKLLGKLIRTHNELLFVFDMNSPEVYKRTSADEGKIRTARIPAYPSDWKSQFGLPVAEHQGSLVVSIFRESAVFGMEKAPLPAPADEVIPAVSEREAKDGNEQRSEQEYLQLSLM